MKFQSKKQQKKKNFLLSGRVADCHVLGILFDLTIFNRRKKETETSKIPTTGIQTYRL